MSQYSITGSPSITRWLDFLREYYIVCNRKKYMTEAIRKLEVIATHNDQKSDKHGNGFQFAI